ncbi:hypothetical protein BHM03_00056010 [Ensete ventricosum]|nr:hypothetical protein BHM03_00056010 [Ensete ventricosum]
MFGQSQVQASGWSEDDAIGNSPGVCRELAEGIGGLLGWRKGVHRKIIGGSRKACRENRETHWEHAGGSSEEDFKTHRKNVKGCRISGRGTSRDWKSEGNHFSKHPGGYTVGERRLHHRCPRIQAIGGGCIAQPCSCTIIAQESG